MQKKNMAASGRLRVAGNAKNQQHVGPGERVKKAEVEGEGAAPPAVQDPQPQDPQYPGRPS